MLCALCSRLSIIGRRRSRLCHHPLPAPRWSQGTTTKEGPRHQAPGSHRGVFCLSVFQYAALAGLDLGTADDDVVAVKGDEAMREGAQQVTMMREGGMERVGRAESDFSHHVSIRIRPSMLCIPIDSHVGLRTCGAIRRIADRHPNRRLVKRNKTFQFRRRARRALFCYVTWFSV